MPGYSRGYQTPTRGRRRRTEWFGGVGGTALSTVSVSGSILLGSGIITDQGEETLVRVRGLLDMFLSSSTSPGDGFFGAVGIGLVSTAAFVGGITTVPTPITEENWDGWLWHNYYSCHESSADEAGSGSSHYRVQIDSKAMRKVEGAMTLYAAIESVEIGTAVMDVFLDTRFLSKLP